MTWVLFLKAYKSVVDRVDRELRRGSPISLAEFEILHMVTVAHGRIRFIDLAKVTLLSQSRISRQIDSLQQKGFLFREVNRLRSARHLRRDHGRRARRPMTRRFSRSSRPITWTSPN